MTRRRWLTASDGKRAADPQTLAQAVCRALPPILSYRLATRIFLRRPQRSPKRFTARTISGALFNYNSGDLLANQVRMCGFWDWRALAIAKTFCADGGTIVEIGANTGTETVGFADIVGRKGRVCAFEPEPAIYEALKNNVELNGFTNVELFRLAVADREGSATFSPSPLARNSGQGFITLGPSGSREALEVATVTLDSFAEKLGAARLVVIDVEGNELLVLRGAREYLGRFRPVVVLEAVQEQLIRAGSDLTMLAAELKMLEYDVFEIKRISATPFDAPMHGSEHYHRNLLCLPRERADELKRVNAMLLACAFAPGFASLNPLWTARAGRGVRFEK